MPPFLSLMDLPLLLEDLSVDIHGRTLRWHQGAGKQLIGDLNDVMPAIGSLFGDVAGLPEEC